MELGGSLATSAQARLTLAELLLLALVEIQEELLFLPATESGRDAITLREMQAVCAVPEWEEQRRR